MTVVFRYALLYFYAPLFTVIVIASAFCHKNVLEYFHAKWLKYGFQFFG